MASPCCLIRVRYELHEVTKELSKPREEDEEVSVVGGHGELCSGETRPWRRRRKNGQWPSPTARMAWLSGGERRGGHGGALVELWFAFLRWRAGVSAAELARQQWRGVVALLLCFGRAEEQRKMWHRGGSQWRAGASLAKLRPDVAWLVRPSATYGAHASGVF